MNIFMQGMRRSGTTIIFDLLWQDKRLDCYYEPLAKAKKHAQGGGSGMTGIDYFEKVRAARESYKAKDPSVTDVDLLHYGAPINPELEFVTNPPDYIKGYIRHMTEQSEHTMIKFTRIHNKMHILHEVDPNAKFVLLLRDPRAITASYLFGKDRKNKDLYTPEKKFFSRKSTYTAWSFRAFSDYLLETPEYSHLKGCEDFIRVLIVWKHTFKSAYQGAVKYYPDAFMILRNEDLLSEPKDTIEKLYAHFGLSVPGEVMDWAVKNIRKPKPPFEHDNDKWLRAFRRVGMLDELKQAGYTDCLREPKGKLISFIGKIFGGVNL